MSTNRSESADRPNGTVIPFISRSTENEAESENEHPYVGPTPVIDTGKLTYTVDEAAYLLHLSRGVTYQYVREGVIPAQRIGRRWVIPRRRFHAWLDGLEAS